MDEDVQPSTLADSISSLEPTQHRNRVLNLQKAARDATTPDKSDIVLSLIDTYRQLSEATSLLPHEWELYLILSIKRASSIPGIDSATLHRLFDLHQESTLQYQSPALFRLYISFVLAYFSHITSIHLPFLTPQDDTDARHSRDPASEFVHLDSCPRIYSASATYELASLPPIADEAQSSSWQQVCGVEEVRGRIREAYSRCAYQLQESQSIWDMYSSFELAILASGKVDQEVQLEIVRQVFLARLRVPHAAFEVTFQAFSSFVTTHLPPQRYEEEMSAANTLFAASKSVYQIREQYEDALVASPTQPTHNSGSRDDLQVFASHWKRYISWQQSRASRALRSKDWSTHQTELELELTSSLFERAIARFALYPPASERDELYCYNPSLAALEAHANTWKRLAQAEKDSRSQSEQQLHAERLTLAESIWTDYITILTTGSRPDALAAIDVCSRSTRVLPTSIQLYATGMRQLARFRRPKSHIEQLFERAASPGALDLTCSRFVDLCLARLDCEREVAAYDLAIKNNSTFESDPATDMDKFMEIYAFVSYAIGRTASMPAGDQDTRLRLETFAVNWVERAVNALGGPNSDGGAGFNELAEGIWQSASSQQPENALVYRQAAAYWMRRFDARQARSWYKAGVARMERNHQARASGQQDAALYEALLQDWLQFEHQYGSVQDIEHADAKIRSERQKVWEAWLAASTAFAQQEQPSMTNGHHGTAMAVDGDSNNKGKRKASTEPVLEDDAMSSRHAHIAPSKNDSSSTGPDETLADGSKRNKTQEAEKGPSRDREHCSVLVANMAPETDAAALRSFLRGCGRIVELSGPSILTGDNSSEAAALVEFSDASGASSARTRDQKMLADRRVSIHLGWQCTLFVTNFPEEWEDADVRRVFAVHGTIFTVRWPSKRFVATRRFCYVQFTSPASAEQAVSALDKQEVAPDRSISVALSDPTRRKGRTDAHENTKELFVSGLPRSITEEELKVPFEEFGPVTGVRLLRTPDGKLRGLGFVDFAQTLDAQKAMRELNSTKLRGKTISVVIAENRGVHGAVKTNPSSSGGRGDASGTTAEQRARSVKVYGLPNDAQEALIQQALERSLGRGSVKTVYWTPKPSITGHNQSSDAAGVGNSAVVEFADLATAGKAVLRQDVRYADEHVLRVSSLDDDVQAPHQHVAVASTQVSEARGTADLTAFVPRASRGRGRGRGRGGLGFVRPPSHDTAQSTPMEEESLPASAPSGQDRFRDMLKRGQ